MKIRELLNESQGVAEATPRHCGPKGAGTELARQIRANGELDRNKQPEPTGIPKKNEFTITEPKAKIQVKKNKGVAEGHADQQRKIFKKNGEPVGEVGIDRESSPGNGQWYMKHYASGKDNVGYDSYEEAVEELKHCLKQGVAEAETDYSKRRQRERDVDAGRPVKPLPKNPQTDYARKRAKEKRDLEQFGEDEVDDFVKAGGKITYGKPQKGPRRPGLSLASRHIGGGGDRMKPSRTGRAGAAIGGKPVGIKEESSTSSEAVERAVLNRIMVAHTDLLRKFGPEKVMQAAEEVAYNVGDIDEIGTSDVSAYVNQVRQILGVEA